MNNFILAILILINKIAYLFSRSKGFEADPLTRRVKREACKYETRRITEKEDVVSCWREGKHYPLACLSFHKLCPIGEPASEFKIENVKKSN